MNDEGEKMLAYVGCTFFSPDHVVVQLFGDLSVSRQQEMVHLSALLLGVVHKHHHIFKMNHTNSFH